MADFNLYEVEAEDIVPVEMNVDTYYKIYNADANTYLSAATGLTMQEENAEGFDQVFSLVATGEEGVYNLATSAGNFFTKGGNAWTTTVVADPDLASDNSKVRIELSGATMTIKSLASDYFGSDKNAAAGSTVYCNKTGNSVIKFKVAEVEGMPAPDLSAYDEVVAQINAALESAVFGDGLGQYPEGSDADLRAALATYSPEALAGYKTQGSVNAVIVPLQSALSAFEGQKKISEPIDVANVQADTYYQFYNPTKDTYLSAKDGMLTMQNKGAAGCDQIFSLVETGEEGVYNLATSGGLFFSIGTNPWDTTVKASPDLNAKKTQVSLVIGESTLTIQVLANEGKFFGSDSNAAANSGIYSDKGSDKAIQFAVNQVAEAATPNLDAYDALVVDANALLEAAVYGEEVGNYPVGSDDALRAVMDMYTNIKTQGTANAALIRLQAAINAFNNARIIGPASIASSTYTITIYNSLGTLCNGWKDGKNIGLFLLPETATEHSYNHEYDIALVEGQTGVYTIKIPETTNYLANDGNALVVTSTLSDNAYFTVETNGLYYLLRNKATNKYLGPQWGGFFDWVAGVTDLNTDASGAHLVLTDLKPTTGIDNVAAEAEGAVEYFNLQGVRVANPENGLFIRRQGNTATKVFIR